MTGCKSYVFLVDKKVRQRENGPHEHKVADDFAKRRLPNDHRPIGGRCFDAFFVRLIVGSHFHEARYDAVLLEYPFADFFRVQKVVFDNEPLERLGYEPRIADRDRRHQTARQLHVPPVFDHFCHQRHNHV